MSIVLNGTTQYLFSSTLYTTYPFSIAGWFKADNDTDYMCPVCMRASAGDRHKVLIAGAEAGDYIRAGSYVSDYKYAISTAGYSASTWHHFAAVWNSTTDRRIYLDGVNKGTNSDSQAPSSLIEFWVGQQGSSSQFVAGKLAEFGVYNIALSDANAVDLADGVNTPADVAAANLVYYWPFYEDPNDDQSSNDLIAYNSPSYDTEDHPLSAVNYVNMVASASGTGSLTGTLNTGAGLAGTISATGSVTGFLSSGPLSGLKVEPYTHYIVAFGNDTVSYESA